MSKIVDEVKELLAVAETDDLRVIEHEAWDRRLHPTFHDYFEAGRKERKCPACGEVDVTDEDVGEYDGVAYVGWAHQRCFRCGATWVEIWKARDIRDLQDADGRRVLPAGDADDA